MYIYDAHSRQVTLKIAYRYYALFGSSVPSGGGAAELTMMDLTQWRRFIDECGILPATPKGGVR